MRKSPGALSFLVLLVAQAAFRPATAAPCLFDPLGELVRQIPESERPGLRLLPGEQLPYPDSSIIAPYSERLDDLYLPIGPQTPEDELLKIAEQLSVERSVPEILSKLRSLARVSSGKVSLKEFLPEGARKLIDGFAECDGPNCHNATVNWFNPNEGLRRELGPVMEERLKRDFDRVVPPDIPKYGDVILIRVEDPGNPELPMVAHTATYLNPEHVWHKATRWRDSPWTFETFSSMVSYYRHLAERPTGATEVRLEYYRKRD